MKLRDALIQQSPSLELQRAAAAEIARLDAALAAAPTPEPQAAQAVAADRVAAGVWELVERFVLAEIDYHEALKSDIGLTAAVSKCNAIEEELRAALAAAAPVAPCACDLAPDGWHGVTPREFAAQLRSAAPVAQPLTPLTLDQISDMDLGAAALGVNWDAKVALVRAVERAHGISKGEANA